MTGALVRNKGPLCYVGLRNQVAVLDVKESNFSEPSSKVTVSMHPGVGALNLASASLALAGRTLLGTQVEWNPYATSVPTNALATGLQATRCRVVGGS
jgi:hypothetical protein